jgi:predicted nucleotidyltransferase
MEHIVSILLYGSYATGEQTAGSDIDVIVVTDNHIKDMAVPQELRGMGYDIRTMPADEIRKLAGKDILLSKSLEAARAILNDSFLEELRSIKPKGSLKERIGLARSSLGIMRSLLGSGADPSALAYPLVMRMKECILMECAMQSRKYSPKLLKGRLLSRGLTKSEYNKLMAAYRAVRDGKKPQKLAIGEAAVTLLLNLLEEMIDDAEKAQTPKKRGLNP